MQKITVYYFTKYDINTDQVIRSKRMATLEMIAQFGCVSLKDTAKEIDASKLDDDGLYREERQ